MNERIRELCIRSGAFEHYEINEGVNGDDQPMQKFAELIIQECADLLTVEYGQSQITGNQAAAAIKGHFAMDRIRLTNT